MNHLLRALVTFLALSIPLQSCASIITGSTDAVTINTLPQGASFHTNAGHSGVTPVEITVSDEIDLHITITKPGFLDTAAVVKSRMSGWVFGNILIGGIVGLIIDFATGNWRTHDSSITVTLQPVGA